MDFSKIVVVDISNTIVIGILTNGNLTSYTI